MNSKGNSENKMGDASLSKNTYHRLITNSFEEHIAKSHLGLQYLHDYIYTNTKFHNSSTNNW